MSDKIVISDLRVSAHIGCSSEERSHAQPLSVSLELSADLAPAAQSKQLKDTICYLTISNQLHELAASSDWTLLEEFAERAISEIFSVQPRAEKIKILVKKFVISDAAWVGVQLKRERAE